MAVVERREQARVPRQQHAVAEHVARHVADADAGEILALAIVAERAEVALHRFPAALGGDAHALVVVAGRAARGERVAQPVVVRDRDAVGDVGELRGTLVGGHHQVRIVVVVAHYLDRMQHLVRGRVDVVGDVEQAVDEHLVAGDALLQLRVALGRRPLHEEAALGTHRHDHGVLHHLRLDQAQHLGAEVLAPVRPAQAAARDRPEAQVHAFHARRVHPDFAVRHRLRDVRNLVRIELVADVFGGLAVALLEIAGAQRRPHLAHEAAQDAVIVEAGDVGQQYLDRIDQAVDLLLARLFQQGGDLRREFGIGIRHRLGGQRAELALQRFAGSLARYRVAILAVRIELGFEQLDQQPGDHRIAVEGFLHVRLRERRADLLLVLAVPAQHRDLAPAEAGAQHQRVEMVVLGATVPDRVEGVLETGVQILQRELERHRRAYHEILHAGLAAARIQHVHLFGVDLEPRVLEQRQCFRQRDVAAGAEDLEMQFAGRAVRLVQRKAQVLAAAGHRRKDADILGRTRGRGVLDVAGGEGAAPAAGQLRTAFLAEAADQCVAQVVVPTAHDRREFRFERGHVDVDVLAGARAHDHVHARHRRVAHQCRGIDVGPLEFLAQHVLDALAHRGVVVVARDEHEAGEEAPVGIAAHEQPGTPALVDVKDAGGERVQLVGRCLQQFVARQGFQDRTERLAGMRLRPQAGTFLGRLEFLAYQRHVLRPAHVGRRGVQAEEALLADRLALVVEGQHADVIHVARPVHARACVGLGQDDRVHRT